MNLASALKVDNIKLNAAYSTIQKFGQHLKRKYYLERNLLLEES